MNEQYLMHHGVKGMRWGHRKARPQMTSGSKNAKSVSENAENTKSDKSKRVKKAVIIGASVAAAGLAVYGAYKIRSIKSQNIALGRYRADAALKMYDMQGKHLDGLYKKVEILNKTKTESFSTAYKNVKEARRNLKQNPSYYGNNIITKRRKIQYIGS